MPDKYFIKLLPIEKLSDFAAIVSVSIVHTRVLFFFSMEPLLGVFVDLIKVLTCADCLIMSLMITTSPARKLFVFSQFLGFLKLAYHFIEILLE